MYYEYANTDECKIPIPIPDTVPDKAAVGDLYDKYIVPNDCTDIPAPSDNAARDLNDECE